MLLVGENISTTTLENKMASYLERWKCPQTQPFHSYVYPLDSLLHISTHIVISKNWISSILEYDTPGEITAVMSSNLQQAEASQKQNAEWNKASQEDAQFYSTHTKIKKL